MGAARTSWLSNKTSYSHGSVFNHDFLDQTMLIVLALVYEISLSSKNKNDSLLKR
jgi:hypothetical protein